MQLIIKLCKMLDLTFLKVVFNGNGQSPGLSEFELSIVEYILPANLNLNSLQNANQSRVYPLTVNTCKYFSRNGHFINCLQSGSRRLVSQLSDFYYT